MLTGKDLYTLLPQSHPMLMIDTLVSSDSSKTISRFTILEDNIFCINSQFREPGIIENMAQTAAAKSGYDAMINNTAVKTGYIGSIKNLKITCLPKLNQSLTTTIISKTEIGNISVIEASVKCQEQIIAECEMTIILLDEI